MQDTSRSSSTSSFTWQQKWIAITPKPFAFLSMIGSTLIIVHILRNQKRRGKVYHRILLGLSVYDTMKSIAEIFGTFPIPAGTEGVFLASGNPATCSAQGFFLQNGIGTPLYNVSLSVYYYLVISRGWKERQLKKVEPLLHGFPIIFSLATSTAAAVTQSYASSSLWCWIDVSDSGMRFGFFYGPLWFSLVTVAGLMSTICFQVWKQERKVRENQRRRMAQIQTRASTNLNKSIVSSTMNNSAISSGRDAIDHAVTISSRKESSSRKVSEQALFYVGSMFVTWIFPSCARFSQMINGSSPFALLALATISAPSQGALNTLVYFRPRYERFKQKNPNSTIGEIVSRHLSTSFVSGAPRAWSGRLSRRISDWVPGEETGERDEEKGIRASCTLPSNVDDIQNENRKRENRKRESALYDSTIREFEPIPENVHEDDEESNEEENS